MPATLKKRNRAVLDSVISEVNHKRILKHRLCAGQHVLLSSKDEAIKTGHFRTGQFYDQDIVNFRVRYNIWQNDSAPRRRKLSRSLSDPTGALDCLLSQENFEDGATKLVSSQNMTTLLETAGQLTWLHFLSESVKHQNKHRGSEPACPSFSMATQRKKSQKREDRTVKFSEKSAATKRDSWQKSAVGQNTENLQVKTISLKTSRIWARRSKVLVKTGKAYFAIRNTSKQPKRELIQKFKSFPKRASLGNIISYNTNLPPIHESHLGNSNETCNESTSGSVTPPGVNTTCLDCNTASTLNHEKETYEKQPKSNACGREFKSSDKKVFFDITSESNDEQQSVNEANVSPSVPRNKLGHNAERYRNRKENDKSMNSASPTSTSSLNQNHAQSSTNKQSLKVGRVENKIGKQVSHLPQTLPRYRKTDPTRKDSMVTHTGFKSSSSESESDSVDEEASAIRTGPTSLQRQAHLDRKFSNSSMQVIGDTSRPSRSITNPSETFERYSGNKDHIDSDDYPAPPLPERMVSFSSKIHAWRASGPDIPRPRARTSGSLPSIMNNLFWPSTTGVSGVANRTNQRSIMQQQQQQQIQSGRFFRRKSSFAVQSTRRLNSLRQSGDIFPPISKRQNLRRTLSQGDFSRLLTRKRFMPLVKFRRVVKMVLILLKATFNNREGGQRRERYLSLWASVLNGKFGNSRRAYEMYGISFDPQEFKANTEVQVSTEVKAILSLEPAQRSQLQLRQALASLRQAVEEFSEFPITMQESLARVGRYEHFEAKRVIIRQGHLAENFYFILSGTAVVTILDTDKQTGEQTARTVNFLGKGKSFGELALMKKSRRTATVRCQEDVELLAVAREDFVDIFMHVERDVEPEHVTFLRSLHVLRGWPVEVLPTDNPRVLVYTYVRRGIVLCKDSNTSEWIYVIKSGSSRVIKALKQARCQQNIRDHIVHTHGSRDAVMDHWKPNNSVIPLPVLRPVTPSSPPKGRRRAAQKSRLTPGLDLPVEKMEQVGLEHYRILDSIHRLRHRLSLSGREVSPSQSTSRSESLGSDSGDHILDSGGDGDALTDDTVFVDLITLLPGDIYGLESCVFNTMGSRTTSTSLVSGGAELIMIHRKFFLDHTSEQLRKRLRREIRPLPSEESLQSQLETKISWEAFRHDTLKQTLQLRRKQAPHACST